MKNKLSTCLMVFGTFLFILNLLDILKPIRGFSSGPSDETLIFAAIGAALAVWGLLIRKKNN